MDANPTAPSLCLKEIRDLWRQSSAKRNSKANFRYDLFLFKT